VGCAESSSTVSNNINKNTFDEVKAISMVVKDHSKFLSSQFDTITKELPIGGGNYGATEKVKFTTKVEKVEESTYIVTLTKDWDSSVNGKYVKSYWEYNVTPYSVILLESIDNENLLESIK
jgi:hypothetical protein